MITRREALLLLAATPAAIARKPMLTRPIPSSREMLPVVGLGTWQTFDVGSDRAARQRLGDVLSLFVQLGGKVIDSSPMYGTSEDVVGDLAVAKGVRGQLFVATKVWTSGKRQGIAQMEDSERKLRGKADLMQVHNLVDADTHLATLRAWKQQGRIRYLGITHYTSGAYAEVERYLAKGGIDFVQINYSVGEREAERTLLPLARERGVAVLVNRPFAGGSLLRRLSAKPLPAVARDLACTSWAQLLLKFVLAHPAVTCAIPGTSKTDHLRDNLAAATGPLPDSKQKAAILAAL